MLNGVSFVKSFLIFYYFYGMRINLVIILMLLSVGVFSQEEEKKTRTPYRNIHFLSITGGFGGPGFSLFSASCDFLIVKNINFELGIGTGLGLGGHNILYSTVTRHQSFSRYRPRWDFFYGLGYANYDMTLQYTSYGRWEKVDAFYFASGVQYISRMGFTLKFELGPGYQISTETWGYDDSTHNTNRFTAYGGLKMGVHVGGKYEPKFNKKISQKDFIKRQRKTKGKYQNEEIKSKRDHL